MFGYTDIVKWGLGQLSALISSATPQPLGIAAAGSTGKAADAGHVHALPTAAQTNAMSLPVSWNASTNSPVLASGTAPTNDNAYVVATAGSTALDGIAAWAVGDIAYYSNGSWHKIAAGAGTVSHVFNYTASAVQTGVSTESAALMSLVLGILPAGTIVDIQAALTGNSDAGTTTLRLKFGATTIATFLNQTAQTSNSIIARLVCTGAAAQFLTGEMRAGTTVPDVESNSLTVDTSSSVTLNATLQNSTTTRTSQIAFLDVLIRTP